MVSRAINTLPHLVLLHTFGLIVFTGCLPTTTLAFPLMKDTPIQKIVVPYQPNTVSGHPYQYPKLMSEKRQISVVPVVMEMVPRFRFNQGDLALGSQKGEPLKFADGAYPVYYMPSNVNGKFNGKISLLEGALEEQAMSLE